MSLWPIIEMRCQECDKRVSVFHYDLDTEDDQQEFFDALTKDGWDTCGKAENVEADDDYLVYGYCPDCRHLRTRHQH